MIHVPHLILTILLFNLLVKFPIISVFPCFTELLLSLIRQKSSISSLKGFILSELGECRPGGLDFAVRTGGASCIAYWRMATKVVQLCSYQRCGMEG